MLHAAMLKGALVVALGWTYNAAVGAYANRRIRSMEGIPLPSSVPAGGDGDPSDRATGSVSELRRTVSRRTGLVENLDDRQAWNRWLAAPPSVGASLAPGDYAFMYRSYVKFEEAGAIKKALWHVPTWLGFINVGRGVVTVEPDGKRVRMTEHFLQKLRPVEITWEGVLGNGGRRIVWTGTKMTRGRRSRKVTIENPEASERLRKIPWDVVKVEDGMAAFRRGDVGMLAYDLKAKT